MENINLFPTAYNTNNPHTVSEATKVLEHWGLSKNDKKTRDLIAKKKLHATHAGTDPNDRRSGYVIHGKDIYDFIVSEIPVAKQLIKEHHELQKAKTPTAKGKGKTTKKQPKKEEQLDLDTVPTE